MAKWFEAKRLRDGRLVVIGVDRADKCLFTSFATPEAVTFNGAPAFAVSGRYESQVREIVRRNNEYAAAQAQGSAVAAAERIVRSARRPATSSGWCEACEDGLINQCKRGGCY